MENPLISQLAKFLRCGEILQKFTTLQKFWILIKFEVLKTLIINKNNIQIIVADICPKFHLKLCYNLWLKTNF